MVMQFTDFFFLFFFPCCTCTYNDALHVCFSYTMHICTFLGFGFYYFKLHFIYFILCMCTSYSIEPSSFYNTYELIDILQSKQARNILAKKYKKIQVFCTKIISCQFCVHKYFITTLRFCNNLYIYFTCVLYALHV